MATRPASQRVRPTGSASSVSSRPEPSSSRMPFRWLAAKSATTSAKKHEREGQVAARRRVVGPQRGVQVRLARLLGDALREPADERGEDPGAEHPRRQRRSLAADRGLKRRAEQPAVGARRVPAAHEPRPDIATSRHGERGPRRKRRHDDEEQQHGRTAAGHRPHLARPPERRRPPQVAGPVDEVGRDPEQQEEADQSASQRLRAAMGRRDLAHERADRREERRRGHDRHAQQERLPERDVAERRAGRDQRDDRRGPQHDALGPEGHQNGCGRLGVPDGPGEDELEAAGVLLAAQGSHGCEDSPRRQDDREDADDAKLDVPATVARSCGSP